MDARPRPKFWLISLALHVVSVALAIAYIPLMAMLYNERFNDTDYNMLADWAMGFGFSMYTALVFSGVELITRIFRKNQVGITPAGHVFFDLFVALFCIACGSALATRVPIADQYYHDHPQKCSDGYYIFACDKVDKYPKKGMLIACVVLIFLEAALNAAAGALAFLVARDERKAAAAGLSSDSDNRAIVGNPSTDSTGSPERAAAASAVSSRPAHWLRTFQLHLASVAIAIIFIIVGSMTQLPKYGTTSTGLYCLMTMGPHIWSLILSGSELTVRMFHPSRLGWHPGYLIGFGTIAWLSSFAFAVFDSYMWGVHNDWRQDTGREQEDGCPDHDGGWTDKCWGIPLLPIFMVCIILTYIQAIVQFVLFCYAIPQNNQRKANRA